MKDEKGYFYYPFPQNKRVRMYVKKEAGEIWFRLWNADDEKLWDDHGWMPYGAIRQAAAMYDRTDKPFDPDKAYDLNVAKALLEQN